MPLSTRTPNPGVCVIPRSTSALDDPIWNVCGTSDPGITFPRLAEVVNCTSGQVPGNVGGTLPGVGHAGFAGAAGITVGVNGLEALADCKSTRYGAKRFGLTIA